MDIFYRDTVTVWNRIPGSGVFAQETWSPVVITGARLLISRGNNIMKSGNASADSARLHISDDHSLADKSYIAPAQFSGADKSLYYTLVCDEKSFFTRGDTSAETVTENFFEHMKRTQDDVFMMSSVDRFELLPHFEVWGK